MPLRGIIIRNRMEAPLYPPRIGRIPLRPALISRLFAVREGLLPMRLTLHPKRLYALPLSSISRNNRYDNAGRCCLIKGAIMPLHFADSFSPSPFDFILHPIEAFREILTF
jgi:hypothetical protein